MQDKVTTASSDWNSYHNRGSVFDTRTTLGGNSTYIAETTESSSDLKLGDHILALPYWSERHMTTRSDAPCSLVGIVGDIHTDVEPYFPIRDATLSDWPLALAPFHRAVNVTSTVYRADWSFNGQQFCQPAPCELPEGSKAEWESLVRLADTKALGNARKALVNLPMIFKERRETLSMIGGKVASMAKGARALQTRSLAEFRKTKPKNRTQAAKRISNEHLEFVFGWLPVIGEIEGAIEFFERDNLDFIRSRGVQTQFQPDTTSKRTQGVSLSYGSIYFGGGFGWGTMETHSTAKSLISVRTALRYKLTTQCAGAAYALGFEPFGTVYDMIPLSFISGWISNFDYYVRTISPLVGMEFETGSRNRRKHSEVRNVSIFSRNTSSRQKFYGAVSPIYTDETRTRDDREVIFVEPEASLDWDVEVGLYEVAAGISLTLQRFIKPLKRDIRVKQFRYRGPRPKWLKTIRYTGRK